MDNTVEQVFLQIVADVLKCNSVEYIAQYKDFTKYSFWEAVGAGSLEVVEIVMRLENEFDINITDEETENIAQMSYNEILHALELAGASAESMRRARTQKESTKPVADKKQAQETPKPVADKKQTQKMEFKTILHQAENLVASIKLFESAQNNITAPSKQQPKPAIELRTMKDGKPYCELLGKKCNRPERPNNTGKVYCEFMNCRIYNNFQRLR